MKVLTLFLLLGLSLPAAAPFQIEATEDVSAEFPGAPRLQSFAFAQWEGRWLFIGGRTAGYHSVGGGSAEFLRQDANRDVWVVDSTVRPARTYRAPLAALPSELAAVRDQWGATAHLNTQDGRFLYIAGGYGQRSDGAWTTFPILSRVDVPKLIDSVMHGEIRADAIQFVETPLARSTGGGLVKAADGSFYLVMGHVFEGNYTVFEGQGEKNSAAASQEYLNEIRVLEITGGAGRLNVTQKAAFQHPTEFHRRDLNVTPLWSPSGLGVAIHGGVFTPDTQLGYGKPIYLLPGAAPVIDESIEQKLNLYGCASVLIYDPASSTMHTSLLGGIGRYRWDAGRETFLEHPRSASKNEPVYLDGLQWSDQVSTMSHSFADGASVESVHRMPLPGYVGADAIFIPADDVPRIAVGTNILDLSKLLPGRTLIGYLFGGIRANPYQFPYTKEAKPHSAGAVPTTVNGTILKVYINVPGAPK